MKSLFSILIALLIGFAASAQKGGKVAPGAKQGQVILRGKIGNLQRSAQLWYYMGDEKWDTIPVKDGMFNLNKQTLLPAYGAIMIRYKPYKQGDKESFFSNMNLQNMYFDEGVMEFSSPVDTLKRYLTVKGSGSRSFNLYQAFWSKEGELIREQRKLAAEFNNATPEQMQSAPYQKAYEEKNALIEQKLKELLIRQIKSEPGSLMSILGFSSFMKRTEGSQTLDQLMAVFNLLSPAYRNSDNGKAMSDYTQSKFEVSPEGQGANANTSGKAGVVSAGGLAIGSVLPEFSQDDPNGKVVKLSDYRGKYVLLDFWASWCVPCRSANPKLVALYNKYKDKGFDVLGISLDSDKSAWQTAIMQDKLYWRQVSDLKGGNNAVAKQFKVNAIPMGFLLDPEGRILFMGHGLDAVEVELAKRLGK